MTKRVIYLLMALVLCLCAMSMALADIVPHGDFEYEENDDGTITITGYTGTSNRVQIPSQIDGKPVTAIGDGAFEGCGELVSVYLNGVERIGEDAFKGCAKLAGVSLSKVKTIEKGAFHDCPSLAEVKLFLYEDSDITIKAFNGSTVVSLDQMTCIVFGEGEAFIRLPADVDIFTINGVPVSSRVGDDGKLLATALGNAVKGEEIMAKVPWIGMGDLLITDDGLMHGRYNLSEQGQYAFTDGDGARVSINVSDPSEYSIGSSEIAIVTRAGVTILLEATPSSSSDETPAGDPGTSPVPSS